MAWLSVIVPTYNGAKYLAEAFDSVVRQGLVTDVELLVVDDGSSDETLSIVDTYQSRLTIVLIDKQPDGNWVSSTNLALDRAKGEFVCFLHQDDFWLPGRLEVVRDLVSSFPDRDIFFTAAQFVNHAGRVGGRWHPPFCFLPNLASNREFFEKLLVQNSVAIPAPVFRKSLAISVGGLDEALWYTADWDFWLKMVLSGRAAFLNHETVAFRIHGQSQTILRSGKGDDFQYQMQKVLERYSTALPVPPVVVRAAHFSIKVNVILASVWAGKVSGVFGLLEPLWRLDWSLVRVYLSASCILQRLFSRIRFFLFSGTVKK